MKFLRSTKNNRFPATVKVNLTGKLVTNTINVGSTGKTHRQNPISSVSA